MVNKLKTLKGYINDLRMMRNLGRGNTCPKCGKIGEFGSVIRVKIVEGKEYLVCGWCEGVSEV